MIISLSDNEQNINAALNSLDIVQRLNSVTSQIQKETALTQQMNILAENYRKLIKNEISTLLDNLSTVESYLHTHSITSYDTLITKCRNTLNSFDPEGKITETDLSL